ncbi:zinc finger protein 626-like [Teleopsis dalmanni]|uniref:zinc finger protein 626-like n=1 Tax=Teleopsis dalmanni TaxID=139649 RepID=UPI0018CE332C|nr:zinc finger protein 626-like [Teleopsis dalmanni]
MATEREEESFPFADTYDCLICKKRFKKLCTYETHMRKYHTGVNTYKCELCNKLLANRATLTSHIRHCHSVTDDHFNLVTDNNCNDLKSARIAKKKGAHRVANKLLCEVCGYQTCISCNFTVHKRIHNSEVQKYGCERCHKRFTTIHQLTEHMRVHSNTRVRNHKCEICGAAFLCSRTLYHHKPLHLENKKYSCTVCNKYFAQAAGLAGHMRRHRVK